MNQVPFSMTIQCYGRNELRQEALKDPVSAIIGFAQYGSVKGKSTAISATVECIYNTGGHGHRCKASHPDKDKIGDGIFCPYAIDLPYTIDRATFKK